MKISGRHLFIPFFSIFMCLSTLNLFAQTDAEMIQTVTGSVRLSDLGFSLSHEHIMSNFGKPIDETSEYDEDQLFKQVVPYLEYLKSLGVETIFDCTTEYFGRRVDLLSRISETSNIQIITNTGFYGAAGDKYIPSFAYSASVAEIASIWIDEFEHGIEGTAIKPGFIKLGFDGGNPSKIDKKLFEAGIYAHLSTGLVLAVHTGENIEAVNYQINLLNRHGVDLSSWIWIHANKYEDDRILLEIASRGAWISLDGLSSINVDKYLERIKKFKERGLLDHLLVSHDGNGFPAGGDIRPFEDIMKSLVPAMYEEGFSKQEVDLILIENPKNAFRLKLN